VFEDNSGTLKMAIAPKLQPQTKYIYCKYHHFRAHVGKMITIHKVDTMLQVADGLTKPLDDASFIRFHTAVLGQVIPGQVIPDSTATVEQESKPIPNSYGRARRHHNQMSHLVSSHPKTKGKIPQDPGLRKHVTHTRAHGTGQAMQSFDLATILPSKSESFLAT
jgi:hypothetical protein